MKTDLLRSFAIMLGLAVASGTTHSTSADDNQGPSKWSSFRAPTGSVDEARQKQLHPSAHEPVTPVAAQQPIAYGQPMQAYPPSEMGRVYEASVGNQVVMQAPISGATAHPVPRPMAYPATPPQAPQSQPAPQPPVARGALATEDVSQVSATAYGSHDCGCNHSSPYAAAASALWPGSVPVPHSSGCASGGCSTGIPVAGHAHVSPGYGAGACDTGGYCAPVATGPGPISPWFGGANLLFWNLDDSKDRPLINYDNGVEFTRTSDLNPGSDIGFDVHGGRYFGCGNYGLDVGFMLWDPDAVFRDAIDGGAGLRFIHPALDDVSINRGAGATPIYDEYDTNAVRIRSRRDIAIQGVEVNLVSFGLMGARRLGRCSSTPVLGHHPNSFGYFGGATGPLARACSGRVRIQSSHGFRWFRFEDELEIIGDVDGNAGYHGSDLYYLVDTENNLFGYQFGSQLTYCLGHKLFLNVGGKFGVYGNDVHFRHTIATQTATAYTNSQGTGPGDLCCEESDVTLAGLGELDLGFGYRLGNRLTFSGGYRVLGVSGIATAIGQMPNEYSSRESAARIHPNDGIVLHGAYVGFDYNW
ncbi:MAG: hypothetical protein AAFV88_06705 [Planctomycetota bacterium]